MALAFTFRSSLHITTNANTYATTAAFTPAAGSLMIACIAAGSGGGAAPSTVQTTAATNRYTFTELPILETGSTNQLVSFWVAKVGATAPNDTITASGFAGTATGMNMSIIEVTGADLSWGVTRAIVQSGSVSATTATSRTITLPNVNGYSPLNRPLAFFAHDANELATERASWTELDDGSYATPAVGAEVQARSDAFEGTGSATWTTSSSNVAIMVEIAAAGTLPPFQRQTFTRQAVNRSAVF